ncbi:GNAT family N-acetyltransferase [Metabacillus lacus]|uniref:GNAT family N-acetyltransferase n=1 Tax=Metabacillus lacus TaxID=1983721 RepID=UPI00147908BC|nr:GNAT family N-acetyltransferase [Metabacillus lacus]
MEKLVIHSPEWRKEECEQHELAVYYNQSNMYNGIWQVWENEKHSVGLSFHVEWAPSNGKAWLGTLLIEKEHRGAGYGRSILNGLAHQLAQQGHKAFFAAAPVSQGSWLKFLAACEFEQFKSEKDSGKEYIISVRPLVLNE